jgi:hypothetical protein
MTIQGLHHISIVSGRAPTHLDFYTRCGSAPRQGFASRPGQLSLSSVTKPGARHRATFLNGRARAALGIGGTHHVRFRSLGMTSLGSAA